MCPLAEMGRKDRYEKWCWCRLCHDNQEFKWKRKKGLSSKRLVLLVIYINGAVPLMSCCGQTGKVRSKQCLGCHPFHSERLFCSVFQRADEARGKQIKTETTRRNLTVGSVISMPTRNINSAMNRLMQRFLWMVLRSLCRPRKKQKVKMLMVRQTRDTTIPTRVMMVRSSSCPMLFP